MQKVKVTITGTKPVLVNRFRGGDEEEQKVQRGKKDYGTPADQALKAAYVREDGIFFFPWTWISGAVRLVSGSFRSTLNKKLKSLKGIVGGAVLVVEPEITFNENIKIADCKINGMGVVVNKARIMRYRPEIPKWSATFHVLVDDTLLTTEEVKEMLSDAGRRAGIGDYRISKGGPYGTFEVTEFQELNA